MGGKEPLTDSSLPKISTTNNYLDNPSYSVDNQNIQPAGVSQAIRDVPRRWVSLFREHENSLLKAGFSIISNLPDLNEQGAPEVPL